MPVKYIPYKVEPLRGQAVLPLLRYHRQLSAKDFHLKGIPYFEVELIEKVNRSDKNPNENLIIQGDCLNACAYLKKQGIQVDLVYIDPPFASGANYAKKIYIRQNPKLVAKLEKAQEKLRSESGEEIDNKNLQMLEETMYGDIWQKEDYLNWLYERLLAIKEVMSETASIYVHLDWHIGHYVKVLMDEVFGEENFKNEIIWSYDFGGRPTSFWPRKHDTLFYYTHTDTHYFSLDEVDRKPYQGNLHKYRGDVDSKSDGKTPTDVWEIALENKMSKEITGYATQKPNALLKRIILAHSAKNMIVADFFGGSGVTAKVAHDLGRKFITADVGINAIQTMRDRLVAVKASFDILKIKDGIELFRNPQQTIDKLASIIPGLSTQHNFGSFWFGAITNKGMVCPCWIPNLKDKQQAILNPALFSKIMDETAKLDGISSVVICSIDLVDEDEMKKMITDYDLRDREGKPVQFIFKDLKELVDLIVSPDIVAYSIEQKSGSYTITIDRFISDALIQKIAEFNAKKIADQKKIEISEEGLELIEFISIDCTDDQGAWSSSHEIKIDKNGYTIVDGKQTKQFWDGSIKTSKKPRRIKVRNIAGDELIEIVK